MDAAPEHLWSLREDVTVVEEAGGDVRVGDVRLAAPGPVVLDALRRMTLGPVLLSNVAGAGGSDELAALADTLRGLHPFVVRSLGAGDARGPLLSVLALGSRPFVLPDLDADARVVGHRPVGPDDGRDFRVDVHRAEVSDVVENVLGKAGAGAPAREVAAAVLLAEPLTLAVLDYLVAAGRLDVVHTP